MSIYTSGYKSTSRGGLFFGDLLRISHQESTVWLDVIVDYKWFFDVEIHTHCGCQSSSDLVRGGYSSFKAKQASKRKKEIRKNLSFP